MKNGKNPLRKQQDLIKKLGWNPDNWLVTKSAPDVFAIVHRHTGTIREYQRKEDRWERVR